MRGIRIYFFILIAFVLFTSSCRTTDSEGSFIAPPEWEYFDLAFKNIALSEAPKPLQIWIEENKLTEQNKVFNVDEKTYVVILLGEPLTSDYEVNIIQINDVKIIDDDETREGSTSVTFEITKLQEKNKDSQDTAFPYAIVEVEDGTTEWVEFSRSLTEEELADKQTDDDLNSSDSNPRTAVASYEWTSHLVPLENLTEDGGVEERNQKN